MERPYGRSRHRACPFRTRPHLHDLRPHSLARSHSSAQRRGEIESPDLSGVFRPRRQVHPVHLRTPVLRAGCRPADGRDRRQVPGHRAADWPVHRDGAGAAVIGAAQDLRRDDVHRQPGRGVEQLTQAISTDPKRHGGQDKHPAHPLPPSGSAVRNARYASRRSHRFTNHCQN